MRKRCRGCDFWTLSGVRYLMPDGSWVRTADLTRCPACGAEYREGVST